MPYALITGASKGIGRAIAAELAARKFDLLLVARSEQELQNVASALGKQHGVKTAFLAEDLAQPGAAGRVTEWVSTNRYVVSVLVNNAGYGLSGDFASRPLAELTAMMQVNMTALVELTYLLLPQLRQQPKGYILNVASTTAYQALPGMSLYAATKTFVLAFSRGLHHELTQSNISVTCVSPGATSTNFNDRADIGEKAREAAKKVTMTPEDVARQAVTALFAGKAEVITGAINKLGAFAAWLLPKGIVEKTAYKIYQ